MSSNLTTDPNDFDLGHGKSLNTQEQSKKHLILSEEERAKGFVRPVRTSYIHTGDQPTHPLSPLTKEQSEMYNGLGFVSFESYGDETPGVVGRFWTQEDLDKKACGGTTRMSIEIAETYARQPTFYGATYCVHCMKYLPVKEFVWEDSYPKLDRVGS